MAAHDFAIARIFLIKEGTPLNSVELRSRWPTSDSQSNWLSLVAKDDRRGTGKSLRLESALRGLDCFKQQEGFLVIARFESLRELIHG
jgi:hypothetical protein